MSDRGSRVIHTPDQRLRVFVSSTLQELADERHAARDAIEQLRLAPVMFELGARPHPPKDLYRAYLDQSDIFVGIYWQKYGWVAPDMDISGLEDEYRLCSDQPRLIYIKTPALDREPRLNVLLDRIRGDDQVSYKPFSTAGELRELIENDLAMILTERFELARTETAAPREPSEAVHPHNLPAPPTALIGRERELATLNDLLLSTDGGLITLTGPGGTGKTRLAVEAARRVLDHFADGAYFVALAPIRDSDLVAPTIAQTLGLRETLGSRSILVDVQSFLRDKRLLLMLDNFEQIVAAASVVSGLVQVCTYLKIVVTSRAPLRVRGEREFPVTPLAVPDTSQAQPVEQLSKFAAVQLFLQRVVEVRPDFDFTNDNARIIAEICRRLDGLPLAIDFAARMGAAAAGHVEAARTPPAAADRRRARSTGTPANAAQHDRMELPPARRSGQAVAAAPGRVRRRLDAGGGRESVQPRRRSGRGRVDERRRWPI
jgi:hypothetical protein